MPEETRTLSDEAFSRIYDLIIGGELPLGGIVNEVSLAQRLGIGRGPVREAVQRLQGLGLVVREPYMRARVVSLSERDIVEIFQLREAVEGMACRLATLTMTDETLETLVRDMDAVERGSRARVGPDGECFDLHDRILAGCGNVRMRNLLAGQVYHLLRIYRSRSGESPGRRNQAHDEHWQIVHAMRTRNADLAESLMRSHIGRATDSLLAAIKERDAADTSGVPRRRRRRRNGDDAA